MSIYNFIADVHVGNPTVFGGPMICGVNTRGRLVLDALERAVQATEPSSFLIICGDLFDTADPTPQLIAEVQRILSSGPNTFILLGNHDMVSTTPGDHALGPLAALDNVVVIESPTVEEYGKDAILMIPFQPGDCREWFPKAVEALAVKVPASVTSRTLAFHLGVIDDTTPSFLLNAHDAIPLPMLQDVMDKHGIERAFCGNWHNSRSWLNGRVCQIGALAPTGFDNPGWNSGGRMVRYDTSKRFVSSEDVPGPRFFSVESLEQAEKERQTAIRNECVPFFQLKGGASQQLVEVRSWGVQARAVVDPSETKAATRAAAAAVKEATTLREALAKYVAQMPVAEGVDREKVRSLAAAYLSKGHV